jgi:hypothetical protein
MDMRALRKTEKAVVTCPSCFEMLLERIHVALASLGYQQGYNAYVL